MRSNTLGLHATHHIQLPSTSVRNNASQTESSQHSEDSAIIDPPPATKAADSPFTMPGSAPISCELLDKIQQYQTHQLERQHRAMNATLQMRRTSKLAKTNLTLKRVSHADFAFDIKYNPKPEARRNLDADVQSISSDPWREICGEQRLRECIGNADLDSITGLRRRAVYQAMRKKGLCKSIDIFESE